MDERLSTIALNMIPEMTARRFHDLRRSLGSTSAVYEASAEQISGILGINPEISHTIIKKRAAVDPVRELERANRQGIEVLTFGEEKYPAELIDIFDPPPVLYCRGQMPKSFSRAIAIVGARKATPYGLMMAERLAKELAEAKIIVVSGMARGIDGAAHKGALAGKGLTVAVLGCGVDIVYPREHRWLMMEIEKQGAVLSEFPLGTEPLAKNFPARNRIISGLTRGTVVVEARLKSGSLITADFALEQGKEVFAVPGPVTSAESKGCHRLIKQGAKLVERAADIWEELNWHLAEQTQMTLLPVLSEDEQRLLHCIPAEGVAADLLVQKSGMNSGAVFTLLTQLELKDLVRRFPGGVVAKIWEPGK